MLWFVLTLISSLCYASTNHIDKYLVSKYLRKGEVGALIVFSSIFSVFALPLVFFIHPEVFSITLFQGVVLAATGVMVVFAILLYLYALQDDEATNVVPFYQTIPIFGFVLGYVILGEMITQMQVVAALLIIAGVTVLSLNLDGVRPRFKGKIVLLMLLASLLYAASSVVFKLVAIEEGFWLSTFWSLAGKVILGGFFLAAIPPYRRQFFAVLRENSTRILALNSLNETLSIFADALSSFAILLVPVVLVLLAEAFQPVFVLLIGVALTIFFPRIAEESLSRRHLTQKILAIGLIVTGAYLLSF